jgi:hypothetical protein
VPESHIKEEAIQIQKDLQYQEKPVKILDSAVRKTRNSEVSLCKFSGAEKEKKKLPGRVRTL